MKLTLTILTVAAVFAASTLMAGPNTYRYKDNEGVLHIGYSIPPEYIDNGYEVVNDSGIVLKTVLPKKVLEEQSAQQLAEAEKRHKYKMQKAKDEALMRYYSSPEDVERARQRKLTQFDNFIRIQERNISSHRAKMKSLQAQAATLERSGRSVPESVLETLKTLEQKIDDSVAAIAAKRSEKETVYAAFETDKKRVEYLLAPQ